MSNQGRIVESWYDEDDGITYLCRQTKWGMFEAWSACMEEDRDIQNKWDGFRFCELKIFAQELKARIKALKQRLKGMQIMYDNVTQSFSWTDPMETKMAEKMDNQIKALSREIFMLQSQYEAAIDKDNRRKYYDSVAEERRKIRNQTESEFNFTNFTPVEE